MTKPKSELAGRLDELVNDVADCVGDRVRVDEFLHVNFAILQVLCEIAKQLEEIAYSTGVG